MIKRSSGFFKIAFFVFCLFIALFLILFSLTDIRNYVTTETCIFVFCISITIIPLILELMVYSIGLLTKGIKISSKEETLQYKSMRNCNIPYTLVNDNGTEKMMFFCEKGRIALLSANNTKIHWGSDKDVICLKTKFGECSSVFKGIYGIKYENVECEVYTMLPENTTGEQNTSIAVESPKENTSEGKSNEKTTIPPNNIDVHKQERKVLGQQEPSPNQQHLQTPHPIAPALPQQQPQPTQSEIPISVSFGETVVQSENKAPLETVKEFDYSLTEFDKLFEETITL